MMSGIYTYKKGILKKDFSENNLDLMRRDKIWIDLKNPNDEDLEILKRKLKIHPTTIEDLKVHNSRVKIEEFSKYLAIVMYNVIEKDKEFISSEVDIIIGRNFIITSCQHDIPEFEELKKKKKKFAKLLYEGTDVLLHFFMDTVLYKYRPIVMELDETIDELEDKVTSNDNKRLLQDIIEIRRKVVALKKYIYPQREKLERITKGQYKFIRESIIPYFRDLHDDVIRISEASERLKDEITAVYDVYMSTISYNTNEVMKILSIVATIMMPLTFITGIFGMNFKNMPLLYNPYGFWISMMTMGILVVMMLIFFKRQRWV